MTSVIMRMKIGGLQHFTPHTEYSVQLNSSRKKISRGWLLAWADSQIPGNSTKNEQRAHGTGVGVLADLG